VDTFFVRKQIIVGAAVFGAIELGILIIRAIAH
jgi:hypothetical protein